MGNFTDERYLKAEGLPLTIIKACVPVDGDTYDVAMQIKTVEEKRAAIYRTKFGDEKMQKELSPVTHATKGKYIPPFLILHVAEHPETKGQSQRLVKALEEAGISAKAYPAEGKNHTTINNDLGNADDRPTREILGFFFERRVEEVATEPATSAPFSFLWSAAVGGAGDDATCPFVGHCQFCASEGGSTMA